jgi:hypothetical protein
MLHSRHRIYRVNILYQNELFDMALTLLGFTFKLPTLYKVLSTLIRVSKFNSLNSLDSSTNFSLAIGGLQ